MWLGIAVKARAAKDIMMAIEILDVNEYSPSSIARRGDLLKHIGIHGTFVSHNQLQERKYGSTNPGHYCVC